ncbi:discoidin domain-containing protein [Streptomyces sp. NPDC048279]|uniref:discoidin domain-containing protein n=1 Tax=Streptomyces sp. NPDC048279 TaxID=3154714 RepID=UPI003418C4D2
MKSKPGSQPSSSASGAGTGPVLLLRGKSVTASSSSGHGWRPELALDGDASTRWSSEWSDPQWISVDLGATARVSSVVLQWENYATDYQIQLSDDAAHWHALCVVVSGDGTESCQNSGTGRYVRMYGTGRENSYGYSLWELKIFGRLL